MSSPLVARGGRGEAQICKSMSTDQIFGVCICALQQERGLGGGGGGGDGGGGHEDTSTPMRETDMEEVSRPARRERGRTQHTAFDKIFALMINEDIQ